MRIVWISLAFNLYWFAAVLGQNALLPFLVIALIGAVFLDRGVLNAALLFTVIGVAGDSVLNHANVLIFSDDHLPLWLILLWAGFGAYVWLVRDWLLDKPFWLLVLAGSVGGAGSYLGGERLGAVTFSFPMVSTALLLAFAWLMYSLIFLTVLKRMSARGNTWQTEPSPGNQVSGNQNTMVEKE